MAAKSTENAAAERETVNEEAASAAAKVPHQHDAPDLEVIEGGKVPFAERAKGILRNKKLLAGVSSVALIAAGVFVVNKKRGEDVSEDEVTSD